MAKILVADDNSNVQKTVALALADLGVEVVAVNNGEAAVRKLADVLPDLVLADIFMPVRNGYEVCEYVKKDARFSHLPVVLLVGAFDPLDEREAQRVGADGILKKPFVPPDPLITMVKMLLERTLGERLVAVGTAETAVAARGKIGGVATLEERPARSESGSGSSSGSSSNSASATETPEEIAPEEFQPPVDHLSFGDGARPMAFGELLDAPVEERAAAEAAAIEPVEDEQILTSSRDASLGDPIFWKTEEPKPEGDEANPEANEDVSPDPPLRAWTPDEEAIARNAEADLQQPVEPFELVREAQDEQPGQASTVVESSERIAQDSASQASLTVETARPEDLAANPLEWMASLPPPPAEESPETATEWDAALPQDSENTDKNKTSNATSAAGRPTANLPAAEIAQVSDSDATQASIESSSPTTPVEPPQANPAAEIPEPSKTQPSLNTLARLAEDTAHSVSKQDWSDLAASLQNKPAEALAEKSALAGTPAAPAAHSQPALTNSVPPASKLANHSTEDTARSIPKNDWAELTASLVPKRNEAGSEKVAAAPEAHDPVSPESNALTAPGPQKNTSPAASPDPVLVEAVVQRILEKMRPQVVDIITKEFLRPIVQALVQREITKR